MRKTLIFSAAVMMAAMLTACSGSKSGRVTDSPKNEYKSDVLLDMDSDRVIEGDAPNDGKEKAYDTEMNPGTSSKGEDSEVNASDGSEGTDKKHSEEISSDTGETGDAGKHASKSGETSSTGRSGTESSSAEAGSAPESEAGGKEKSSAGSTKKKDKENSDTGNPAAGEEGTAAETGAVTPGTASDTPGTASGSGNTGADTGSLDTGASAGSENAGTGAKTGTDAEEVTGMGTEPGSGSTGTESGNPETETGAGNAATGAESADTTGAGSTGTGAGAGTEGTAPGGEADGEAEKRALARAEAEKAAKKAWKTTFLAGVPEFSDGFYSGLTSEDTFDYALFTEVNGMPAFEAYIGRLIGSGFDVDPDTGTNSSIAWYYAQNPDGWRVSVDSDLKQGTMRIGSGYRDEETPDNEETLNLIWSTTLLGKLPLPFTGTVESYSSDKKKAYVIFADFSESYADEYRSLLKAAGFTTDADEGKSDGFIWYMGYNSLGEYAELSYSDGTAKLLFSLS